MTGWRGGELIKSQLGRSGVIRTRDPLVPNEVRYQAALHSDCRTGGSIDQAFEFHKRLAEKKFQVSTTAENCQIAREIRGLGGKAQ